ncbi:MAG TPA: carboxymuconolactone decarboxylase family protein [Chloroflexi bacterium]|nr:carboxymuconolactone decarboxylase family protein [Chloroflexota bacterium]
MKKKFLKRRYPSLRSALADFKFMRAHRADIRDAMRNSDVDEAFRERLMLAVTQVNGCRYCSYFHAREALRVGISSVELAAVSSFDFADSPPEQQPALLYAQHWAESDTHPDNEIREHMLTLYGEETLKAIEMVLRMIRMGNLMGNTFDYVLFKISFGLLGQ